MGSQNFVASLAPDRLVTPSNQQPEHCASLSSARGRGPMGT